MTAGESHAGLVQWEDVKDRFDPAQNGTAPDVVVPGTTLADWESLFRLIRSEGWRCEYEFHDERQPMPASAGELFAPDPGWASSVWVWPEPGLEWIIRVGSPDEIVGDVDLHQTQGQERFGAFYRFLRTLGVGLGKSVLMHAEGDVDGPPMLAYEVTDD